MDWVSIVLVVILILGLIWIAGCQIREHLYQDDPYLHILKETLKDVHPGINNVKLYVGPKSYTINKDRIHLCLKDENGEYYPFNHMVYVFLHEYAHKLNKKDIGHTEEFNRIFDELLARATELGIFNPSIPIIIDYCNYND